ncbi:MAG TPA: methyltransferase domain-containing protein [Streptosporangiales bacterium]
MTASSAFEPGTGRWLSNMDKVRQVVRQELVSRQLVAHLPTAPVDVLDVGCGQGSQAIRLARAGHRVTGLDASDRMLDACREALEAEPAEVRGRLTLVQGDGHAVPDLFADRTFDAVLCHGVLMYLPDPAPLLRILVTAIARGGLLSVLVRNGDALAFRPALLGNWQQAYAAFMSPATYVNRLGVEARADRLDDVHATLHGLGLEVEAWYGVRTLTDALPDEAPPADIALVLDCEERAGRTDPYRHLAGLYHLIGRTAT